MNFQLDKLSVFDSHCHPQFPQYDKDREEMIKRTKDADVFMICVGTDLETSKQAIELAKKHSNMWASVGLHPNDNLNEKFEPEKYRELLQQEKVVAFGEIGLDYYRTEKPEDQKFQKERFIQQLQLAEKVKLPVILHSRDAGKGSTGKVHEDMITILKNNFSGIGVAHSFTGSMEDAKRYIDMGFYLGFNGIITFANQYDAIVREVPVDKILLETDAPYLTPEPYRGQRNEPAYVKEVANKIAQLKGISTEEVIRVTTQNVLNLFKINI